MKPGAGNVIMTPFAGVRLTCHSARAYDQVLASLAAELGDSPVDVCAISAGAGGADAFQQALLPHIGACGLLLLSSVEQGGWLPKFGLHRRLRRLKLGNPLLAIDLLGHDLAAGLFMPADLLLVEGADHRSCSVIYLQPSSLMLLAAHPGLRDTALALDAKLAALVAAVTA